MTLQIPKVSIQNYTTFFTNKEVKTETLCKKASPPPPNSIKEYFTPILLGLTFFALQSKAWTACSCWIHTTFFYTFLPKPGIINFKYYFVYLYWIKPTVIKLLPCIYIIQGVFEIDNIIVW